MRPPFQYDPPTDAVPILLETDETVFVNKPSGLLSVPGRLPEHKDNLFGRLLADFTTLRVIHRLDMDTSGVMVFAKTEQAQREINWQFERRLVDKTYIAEVSGQIADKGTVDLPLMADWPNRPLQKVDAAGKPSVTHWTVLRRKAQSCLVELTPETGRSHQLRVHMAAQGHAILGDAFYADEAVASAAGRLMLHAQKLCLQVPGTSEKICVVAPSVDFDAP